MKRIQRINDPAYGDYTINFKNKTLGKDEDAKFIVEKSFLKDIDWYRDVFSGEWGKSGNTVTTEVTHTFEEPYVTKESFRLFLDHIYAYGGHPDVLDLSDGYALKTKFCDNGIGPWLETDFVGLDSIPDKTYTFLRENRTVNHDILFKEDFKECRQDKGTKNAVPSTSINMLSKDITCAICRVAKETTRLENLIGMYEIASFLMSNDMMEHCRNLISCITAFLLEVPELSVENARKLTCYPLPRSITNFLFTDIGLGDSKNKPFISYNIEHTVNKDKLTLKSTNGSEIISTHSMNLADLIKHLDMLYYFYQGNGGTVSRILIALCLTTWELPVPFYYPTDLIVHAKAAIQGMPEVYCGNTLAARLHYFTSLGPTDHSELGKVFDDKFKWVNPINTMGIFQTSSKNISKFMGIYTDNNNPKDITVFFSLRVCDGKESDKGPHYEPRDAVSAVLDNIRIGDVEIFGKKIVVSLGKNDSLYEIVREGTIEKKICARELSIIIEESRPDNTHQYNHPTFSCKSVVVRVFGLQSSSTVVCIRFFFVHHMVNLYTTPGLLITSLGLEELGEILWWSILWFYNVLQGQWLRRTSWISLW